MIIIAGPTGVGKTELSLKLAAQLENSAIINADLGQLYTPLTIGTAKPDWRNEPVPHYLFDLLDQSENFTAFNYRRAVIELFKKLNLPLAKSPEILGPENLIEHLVSLNLVALNNGNNSRKRELNTMPILVGGSGFYLQALFFKSPLDNILTGASDNRQLNYDNNFPVLQPWLALRNSPEKNLDLKKLSLDTNLHSDAAIKAFAELSKPDVINTTGMLWQKLNLIDPVRAQEVDPHDHYRIQRALEIWQTYKILPSKAKPEYAPIVPKDQKVKIIILNRDLPELYARIDQRVLEMLSSGWLTEVQSLVDTPWEKFLLEKRLIGYDDLLINLKSNNSSIEVLAYTTVQLIQKRSRNYAKRQIAFFKMLTRKLLAESAGQIEIEWLNLTATDVDLYIKRLLSDPNFVK